MEQSGETPGETIDAEITRLASEWFGQELRVIKKEKINHRAGTDVVRVWLRERSGSEVTCVAKYPLDSIAEPEAREVRSRFFEERLNYQFLAELRERFDRFPLPYAIRPRLLLLEDLPSSLDAVRSEAEIERPLAETLADLHAATRDQKSRYQILRDRAIEEIGQPPLVRFAPARVFMISRELVAEQIEILTEYSAQDFLERTAPVLEKIQTPGQFETFIHDDIIANRQCVLDGGVIRLLDFEHGNFGHGLMDLARLLIGKVEMEVRFGRLTYIKSNFSPELVAIYRERLEAAAGRIGDNADWEAHLAACLVLHAVSLIKQTELGAREKIVHEAGTIMKAILERLFACLEPWAVYPELRRMLESLATRVHG